MDNWEPVTCPAAYLREQGLKPEAAARLVEVIEADTLDDLALLDASLQEEALKQAGLGLAPAQRFRLAIQKLRAEQQQEKAELEGEAQQESTVATEAEAEAKQTPSAKLEECVAICIDRSGSMGCPFSTDRTRMEAVKQMFYAFRDRVENLGCPGSHRLGLLQFDNTVEELLAPTADLETFEAVLDDMDKRGMTAIFSAVVQGVEMIRPIGEENPDIALRVVLLTDGQSNTGLSAVEALQEVLRHKAVVDAIIVGDQADTDLLRLVKVSGGECFQISDLGEGFELLEAERVVSLKARGEREPVPTCEGSAQAQQLLLGAKVAQAINARQASTMLTATAKAAQSVRVSDLTEASRSTKVGSAGAKRVLKEIEKLAAGGESVAWGGLSGEGVHIFPSPDDILFWRALIEGPPGSPFEGGVFVLRVNLPDTYPFASPTVVFETPVYHCNVTASGSICHTDLLHWDPTMTAAGFVAKVRRALVTPDFGNAMRGWVAEEAQAWLQHGDADTRYPDNVRSQVQEHASKTVDEWKAQWGL